MLRGEREDQLVLIDLLLPPDPAPVYELIEKHLGSRLPILITIPYHVRSAQELRDRYRKESEVTIWGHAAVAKRLRTRSAFVGNRARAAVTGRHCRLGTIGKPRRQETPLLLPSHGALVFGDAVAETGGRLRVWSDRRVDEKVERFYRERFNPHPEAAARARLRPRSGDPRAAGDEGGARALVSALRSKPWYNRG